PGPLGPEHVDHRTTAENHDDAQGGCRVGQTSTEAKREVEQTRAHLGETLEALQLRARRNLDIKTQLQTNRAVQVAIGALVLAVTGFAVFGYRARRRRSLAGEGARGRFQKAIVISRQHPSTQAADG